MTPVGALAPTETSCLERIEATLAAIEKSQPRLNAVSVTLEEQALAEAALLDRDPRRYESAPLRGVPVIVKELFNVKDTATTGGCAAYRTRIAPEDADAVAALRRAGAVIVAKANQHELGAGATGLVSCFGPVRNPWDPERIAGGSSSGCAAAVAAGIVPLALGSDTGGSIRMPASFCGVTGLRPTPGRVSLRGALAMSPGYDTAGPLAGTARDCALLFAALTGTPVRVPSRERPLRRLRVGLPEPYFGLVHPETHRGVEEAGAVLRSLGASVDRIDGPGIDETFEGFLHVWADVAHTHRGLWDDRRVSAEVRALIDLGRRITGLDYSGSRLRALRMRDEFDRAFVKVDVLLTPSTPYPAPRADDEEVGVLGGVVDVHRGGPSRLTVPVNEAGLPAVAFPVGTSTDGMPLGAQLVGRPFADELLLDVVTRYQEAIEAR